MLDDVDGSDTNQRMPSGRSATQFTKVNHIAILCEHRGIPPYIGSMCSYKLDLFIICDL